MGQIATLLGDTRPALSDGAIGTMLQAAGLMPGASPETVASSLTTPLERALGAIAGVTEMTSQSTVGNSRITLQFDLSRSIDGAARDVQAAINAARMDMPGDLPANPQYRKVNPADAPVLVLALTSETLGQGRRVDEVAEHHGELPAFAVRTPARGRRQRVRRHVFPRGGFVPA